MTQNQILSIIGVAVLVSLYLISVAITYMRRRREQSRQFMAVAGPTAALSRPGPSLMSAGSSASITNFAISSPPPPGGGDAARSGVSLKPLPGIEDAIAWTRLTEAETARISRYNRNATIALIELDGLDRLIASLGAAAGDRIIEAAAATICAEARATDTVARLGPHRFGVLMPETDKIAAINFTERVREICDRWLQTGSISLRLAIGISSLTSALGVVGAMQVSQDELDRERRPNSHENDAVVPEGDS